LGSIFLKRFEEGFVRLKGRDERFQRKRRKGRRRV
jgi:hypothetical protein